MQIPGCLRPAVRLHRAGAQQERTRLRHKGAVDLLAGHEVPGAPGELVVGACRLAAAARRQQAPGELQRRERRWQGQLQVVCTCHIM